MSLNLITRINEDFLDATSPSDATLSDVSVSEDELDKARKYRRMLRVHFCCDDDETEVDINSIARNSQRKLNWLLETSQSIVEHSDVVVKTFNATISRHYHIECEHDSDDSDIDSKFFFEFCINDNFKTNESVIRFFHSISRTIWNYTETSDAHLDFEEFDSYEGQWCVQPDVESFSEFCDEDLMSANTTYIWQYYDFMMRYHFDRNTWKFLCSYVSPEFYVWDFLENCTRVSGRLTFRASNKDAELESAVQDLKLCDLSWTQLFGSFEDGDVIFYNCDASSDSNETVVVVEPDVQQYIEDKLHFFKGMKPMQFGYNFWNHTCMLYLYMGCHWINDIHVHLGISVLMPYEEPQRCEKICHTVFGCSTPDYFNKLASKE